MTWLAHRITDTLRDWWSDPAYRESVILSAMISTPIVTVVVAARVLAGGGA
ncbi:hypothetical protein [Embleya scabrispora]|uniref:hypothetical protein n=1 Tax=Embleya scabrispora TaxID=159449 RepID=UPI0013750366|nr:hypothetical protein [Embleya scabrispora]